MRLYREMLRNCEKNLGMLGNDQERYKDRQQLLRSAIFV